MTSTPRILVIGAGPTGITAAWRLRELGHSNWLLAEANDTAGGLASSVVDPAGFTWDLGGHVLFSHYRYFDRLMDAALGTEWVEHVREAWVWMRDRWIPYPLQNNIWRLPAEELIACLDGLVEVQRATADTPPPSFREWLLRAFGRGLCDTFMFPYNRKVWGLDPAALDVGWMGERVATVDLARVLRNLVRQQDDIAWGPNATFRFPLRGGTGAIWSSLFDQLPEANVALGRTLRAVATEKRMVQFEDGSWERYDRLISSIPLDLLLERLTDRPDLSPHAEAFVHSSSHIVGVGLAGQTPEALKTKCWMYFPEPDTPFYRTTVFSNYSPHNVPEPGEQWSLMAEVSESAEKPEDVDTVVDRVVHGFRSTGLIDDRARIVSTWHRRIEHGYPTPWLGRDAVLDAVDAELLAAGIHSRGRFGAWKYEVSNQDHSAMQGVEAVDAILLGGEESTRAGHMDREPPRQGVHDIGSSDNGRRAALKRDTRTG